MACYSQYTPRLTVSGLPSNVSKPKVRMKLEDVVGKGKILSIDYITKTTAKVVVVDDEAQRKLLSSEISLQFGDNNYPIFVEKMLGDSSEDELGSSVPSDDEVFEYEPSDKDSKAILRYLSRNDKHKQALEDALKDCGSKLIHLLPDEVEAMLPKVKRGGQTPQQICEECIANFMKQFSCWNEKLEDCTGSNVTYVISVLAKYKDKCFGTWYKDTKTILVIGCTEDVDEIKQAVKSRLGTAETKTVTATGTRACPFHYEKVPPQIMRFVLKLKHYHSSMESAMAKLANVVIKEENSNLSICVTPNKFSESLSHIDFVQRCENELAAFFGYFDTWKGQFDKQKVKAMQLKSPHLFKTVPYPDHFVKWFLATGTVIVTGTSQQVKRCRQIIEQMFGVSSPQGPNVVVPLYTSLAPTYPLYPIPQLPNQLPVEPPSQLSPIKTQQSQQTRRTSGDFSDEPGSPRPEKVLFDTGNIPAAVLKYVSNDSEWKKKLGKCCKRLAKVTIKNDHGQLKVQVDFKKKDISPQDKKQVFTAVEKYFTKFHCITKKYDVPKLKDFVESNSNFFMTKHGVYIKHFPETGTVKIIGLVEKISDKEKELDFEMNAELEIETLPVDVFIAQKQCLVWDKVEKSLAANDLKISITSIAPSKIQYKGSRPAILQAKECLGRVSMSLFQKKLTGLSQAQIAYLTSCGKSQREFVQTGKNLLDPLYEVFKENSINGSLAFQDDGIDLVCSDHDQWTLAENLLARIVVHFEVNLGSDKPGVSFTKKCKIIREKLEDEPTYVEEQPTSKKILVFCLEQQKAEMEKKLCDIRNLISDVEEVERFYSMEEERAKHILNPHSQCKLYKAKSVKIGNQSGHPGLLVTCEKEDIDSVDMSIEDLKLEIVRAEEKIPGYFLYELFTKDEKHFRVERETKTSIFLKPDGKKKIQQASHVIAKVGNILDEDCDAIVNSTGKSVSFAGQVSKALIRKYGSSVKATLKSSKWIVNDQVLLCPSGGLLPWNSILNVATPKESQLKKFILNLLCAADKHGISSIAIPTIGTGNMGLSPIAVANAMKEAFAEFCSGNVRFLRDIRVIVYEQGLFSLFKDIAPEDEDPKSTGVVATIYGNSSSNLEKAIEKLKEIRDGSIRTAVVQDPSLPVFPSYVKSLSREICRRNEVYLEWKKNGAQESGHLQGILENVNRAEVEMRKLLEADFPHNWTPMADDQVFARVVLDITSDEFQSVRAKFKESSPLYTKILKIERIQNPLLYKQFKVRKEMRQSETKLLFHGTAACNVNAICASNFDRNFAGENGTAYGRGVYFHIDSSYSVRYADQGPVKCVFLAEVITGEYTLGKQGYKAAPEKGSSKMQYDSVVDNRAFPTIFVVFRDASAYPLYLISFC